jgi:hypothetical protein
MANRNFQNNMYHMERAVVKLFIKVTKDSAALDGSTFVVEKGNGISTVEEGADATEVKITLDDSYFSLLGVNVMGTHLNVASLFNVLVDDVKATKVLMLKADALMADTDVIYIELTLKNSSMAQ